MKNRIRVASCRERRHVPAAIALALIFVLWAAPGTAAEGKSAGPAPLGKMTAFWRQTPVIDRWMKGRLGFTRIPDYLCDPAISFLYHKKSAEEEIPFADALTAVRFLGGWNQEWNTGEAADRPAKDCDLAYRDKDGKIRYRWELLGPRLDHYINGGYGLTIVLDNTPWCFPATTAQGANYGQSAPPADFKEWGAFVEELCKQLAARYGSETTNRFRFRMGTECQSKKRFTATQEQFLQLYDYASAGVKKVLPGAAFGPFNAAGADQTTDKENVNYMALVDHCMTGKNYATGQTGAPLDFVAVSQYAAPSIKDGLIITSDPERKANLRGDFWDAVSRRDPKLAHVSREVHEFGILHTEFKAGSEQGSRLAAWMFHCIVRMRERGMDRLWHWGTFDKINSKDPRYLLTGDDWLYAVLEHTVGGDAFVLTPEIAAAPAGASPLGDDPQALARIAAFQRPEKLARAYKTMYKCLAVASPERTFAIVSAFNEDRFMMAPAQVTIFIPGNLLPRSARDRVRYAALTATNNPHFRIREDLASAGLLDKTILDVPGLLGTVSQMGGRPAWEYVNKNWPRYEAMLKDLLTLKPFPGECVRADGGLRISFPLAPSAVVVIEVE